MKGLNQVQLIGNLGKDPEMKFTANGKAVTSFSLATSRKYRKKEGDALVEEVEWHNIVTYDKLAESINQALNKGSAVAVTGRLHYQKWEDDKQQKHDRTVIIAGDVIYLDKPNGKHEDNVPVEEVPF